MTNILDITLGQIILGLGAGIVIFGGISLILWLINYIINWKWWRKEFRKDFYVLRYFFRHKEEIEKYIKGKK